MSTVHSVSWIATVRIHERKFTLRCQICESSVTLSGLKSFPVVVVVVMRGD